MLLFFLKKTLNVLHSQCLPLFTRFYHVSMLPGNHIEYMHGILISWLIWQVLFPDTWHKALYLNVAHLKCVKAYMHNVYLKRPLNDQSLGLCEELTLWRNNLKFRTEKWDSFTLQESKPVKFGPAPIIGKSLIHQNFEPTILICQQYSPQVFLTLSTNMYRIFPPLSVYMQILTLIIRKTPLCETSLTWIVQG